MSTALSFAEHGAEHAEGVWGILTDPAHWVSEFVMNAAFVILGSPLGAIWVRLHDRKHHGDDA